MHCDFHSNTWLANSYDEVDELWMRWLFTDDTVFLSVMLHYEYVQMNSRFCALRYWLHLQLEDSTWTRYISSGFLYHTIFAKHYQGVSLLNHLLWMNQTCPLAANQARDTFCLNSVQSAFRNYCALLKQHSVALTYIWQWNSIKDVASCLVFNPFWENFELDLWPWPLTLT